MNKYFEFKYWQEIIGLIVVGLVILIVIFWFTIDCIINTYKSKSKKWEYNCVTQRWEKVNKND
jgi:hypothetical protein